MQILSAINRVLPALGENPVDSVDSRNPTVAIVLNAIIAKNLDVQLREWWFNTFDTKLYRGADGMINLPADTLSWNPKRVPSVQRGNYLFDPKTMSAIWPEGTVLEGKVRTLVPFEELPEIAASYVLYAATCQAYINDIGVEEALRDWRTESNNALVTLEIEHLRNRKYTTQRSPRYGRIRRAMRG